MSPLVWSPWEPVAVGETMSASVLAETLDGGQSFRWHREISPSPISIAAPVAPEIWLGTFGDHVVRLSQDGRGRLQGSVPRDRAVRSHAALRRYFDVTRDVTELVDRLPWRSDPHLAIVLKNFPGLRILRQPFGETLLGFLCSATKQIVQIKQMIALLATRHGAPLVTLAPPSAQDEPAPNVGVPLPAFSSRYRLPTWPELAEIPEEALRRCLLGFRARYIHRTAQFLAARPGWLEETEALPYAAAKERLCTLPGVGEKVADCVLLFGAGRLEAFPVDVWIIKTMERRYGLGGWKPAQIAHFGRTHFGALAGLAQQYLFAYERFAARTER